jgi:hypothetical protein
MPLADDLYAKGDWMVVFPRFDGGSCEFATHMDVLLSAGVAPAWLRDSAPGKTDDVLAVKAWSAEVRLDLSERLHEPIGLVDPGSPRPVGASEQALAHTGAKRRGIRRRCDTLARPIGFMSSG